VPAPVVIQNSPLTVATGSVTTITLTDVTAGSNLVLLLAFGTAATRTFTVADNRGNTWTEIGSVVGVAVQTSRAMNVAGGTTQLTITQSGTFVAYSVAAVEVSTSTFVDDSAYIDTNNSTTHWMASADELDVPSDGLIIGIGLHNSSGGTLTKSASHTNLFTPTTTVLAQYIAADAGFVNERSSWTSTIARRTFGASIAFQSVGGGSSFKSAFAAGSNIFLGV
jgi:hypothetical protein